jgi:hypothetical protein
MTPMRRSLIALATLTLLTTTTTTAQAADPPVIGSFAKPALALTTDDEGEVTVRPRFGGPEQQWRINVMAPGNRVVLTNWFAHGCLAAYAPQDVRVSQQCPAGPDVTWRRDLREDSSFNLESEAHEGQCLTTTRVFQRVELTPCDGDPDQFWTTHYA